MSAEHFALAALVAALSAAWVRAVRAWARGVPGKRPATSGPLSPGERRQRQRLLEALDRERDLADKRDRIVEFMGAGYCLSPEYRHNPKHQLAVRVRT